MRAGKTFWFSQSCACSPENLGNACSRQTRRPYGAGLCVRLAACQADSKPTTALFGHASDQYKCRNVSNTVGLCRAPRAGAARAWLPIASRCEVCWFLCRMERHLLAVLLACGQGVMYGTIITVAGGALVLGDDNRLGDTFWRSADALMVSSLAAQAMKITFQRERPSMTNDPGRFFSGIHHNSFPQR